ncbi:hypothetical protein ABW20_dc0103887 [Dactylellina cionopaga]|nr:hypothetical protein ABW20_dc0103887 [Dactylellina cionopaga]
MPPPIGHTTDNFLTDFFSHLASNSPNLLSKPPPLRMALSKLKRLVEKLLHSGAIQSGLDSPSPIGRSKGPISSPTKFLRHAAKFCKSKPFAIVVWQQRRSEWVHPDMRRGAGVVD